MKKTSEEVNSDLISEIRLDLANKIHPQQTEKLKFVKDSVDVKKILSSVRFCNNLKAKSLRRLP